MSATCWVKALPIRMAAFLLGAWASQSAWADVAAKTNGTPSKYEEPKASVGSKWDDLDATVVFEWPSQ